MLDLKTKDTLIKYGQPKIIRLDQNIPNINPKLNPGIPSPDFFY